MRYALIAFLIGLVSTFALYGAQAGAGNTAECALPAHAASKCKP